MITGFIADWKPTIEVVAVVLGLVFVLFGPPPTGFSVLLTAVIVVAVVVAMEVLAAPEPDETAQEDNADGVETVEIAGD